MGSFKSPAERKRLACIRVSIGFYQGFIELMDAVVIVQELRESRGGRPGLPVLVSLTVSVDVKKH